MQAKDFTSANRAAWDQVAPLHRSQNHDRLLKAFSEPGYSCLNNIETTCLKALDIAGKDIAQICCNNGRELMSVKNMGAGRCVGFDGSAGFVEQARDIASKSKIECEFLCTDIYEISPAYYAGFDVVTITIGVLSWMPELDNFFAILFKLLRPGGALFIYEQHPVLDMIKPAATDDPVVWECSYFSKEPYVGTGGLDYYGGGKYESKPLYSFSHTMAEIIMAGVNTGMAVEHFEEHPDHISNDWWNVEKQGPELPMSYTLVLRRS